MTNETVFLKEGTAYQPINKANLVIEDRLPPGNYTVKQKPMNGPLYFARVDDFPANGKIYGNSLRNAGRILNTFEDRPSATGVLLTGEKGSGKTMLAKELSMQASQRGYPTILINAAWSGEAFNELIQSLEQPAVVLFDEFEKIYDRKEQEEMLTLLDGVFPSKKLFVLTCNDVYRINEHMRNRPGRIFYSLDFKGLDKDFIVEYCEDRLINQSHINGVVNCAQLFHQFNFDMLKALVEEMNRYNEDASTALELLNARPSRDEGEYEVVISNKGVPVPAEHLHTEEFNGHPLLAEAIGISFNDKMDEVAIKRTAKEHECSVDDVHPYEHKYLTFNQDQMVKMDVKAGSLTYEQDGYTLVLTKKKDKQFSFSRYAY